MSSVGCAVVQAVEQRIFQYEDSRSFDRRLEAHDDARLSGLPDVGAVRQIVVHLHHEHSAGRQRYSDAALVTHDALAWTPRHRDRLGIDAITGRAEARPTLARRGSDRCRATPA